jgi:hypothetical protein
MAKVKNTGIPTPEQQAVIQPEKEAKQKGPGFVMVAGNPYVDGVLRFYARICDLPASRLTERPFVLLPTDPNAVEVLANYALRAAGACDKVRVEAVEKAIGEFKKI